MNEEQLKYLANFKKRLAEDLDIIEDTHYSTRIEANGISVTFKVLTYNNNITYSIMGMIYHFSNRKWIIDFGYMYILKSVQTVIFNDGTVETN